MLRRKILPVKDIENPTILGKTEQSFRNLGVVQNRVTLFDEIGWFGTVTAEPAGSDRE
jgi:hypothetical protein